MRLSVNIVERIFLLTSILIIILLSVTCKPSKERLSLFRIVLVQYNDSPLSELSRQGIKQGLDSAGLVENKDYELKITNAQGDIGTLNLIFDGVLNEKPNLVMVTSTPTLQVAIKKIKDIPVVFTVVADPLTAGAGRSFEEHLSNVTGISTLGDYKGMAALIRKIFPDIKNIGTLYSPGEANSVVNMNDFRKCTEAEGIELITVPVNSSNETADATLALIARQPGIVCQIIDNLTAVSFSSIIKICRDKNVPVFGFVSDQADKGAVLVLSRDYIQAGIDAAHFAIKIMNGADPGTIPFQYPSKTNLLINPAAAERYGIVIPEEILNLENAIIRQ